MSQYVARLLHGCDNMSQHSSHGFRNRCTYKEFSVQHGCDIGANWSVGLQIGPNIQSVTPLHCVPTLQTLYKGIFCIIEKKRESLLNIPLREVCRVGTQWSGVTGTTLYIHCVIVGNTLAEG